MSDCVILCTVLHVYDNSFCTIVDRAFEIDRVFENWISYNYIHVDHMPVILRLVTVTRPLRKNYTHCAVSPIQVIKKVVQFPWTANYKLH